MEGSIPWDPCSFLVIHGGNLEFVISIRSIHFCSSMNKTDIFLRNENIVKWDLMKNHDFSPLHIHWTVWLIAPQTSVKIFTSCSPMKKDSEIIIRIVMNWTYLSHFTSLYKSVFNKVLSLQFLCSNAFTSPISFSHLKQYDIQKTVWFSYSVPIVTFPHSWLLHHNTPFACFP